MISISRMGVVDVSQLAKVTVSARASFGRLKLLIEVVLDLPLQIFLSQRQMMLRMMLMVCSLHDSDIRGGAWLHERLVPTMIWCIDLDMWVCFKHSLVKKPFITCKPCGGFRNCKEFIALLPQFSSTKQAT